MKHLAIIGGGISGLSAAFYLKKYDLNNNYKISIFEANATLGGKIQTNRQDNHIMEAGADSFLKRKPAGMQLIKDLNLQSKVYENKTGQSFIASQRGIHAMPEGTYMGIPVDERDFLKSKLMSEKGKQRALAEINVPKSNLSGDQSLGRFLRYRFGDELVDEVLAPLLSGIYSSDIDKMSLLTTFPQFAMYEETYGSIMKGLRENMDFTKPRKPQFASLSEGLSTIIEALEAELKDNIYKNTKITSIKKKNGRYELTSSDSVFEMDEIISAVPFPQFQKILVHDKTIQSYHIEHLTVSNLAVSIDSEIWQPDFQGTGFVAAKSSGLNMTACTWVHQKWPHTAPRNKVLLRAYLGRANKQDIFQENDECLKNLLLKELSQMTGVDIEPDIMQFSKWTQVMPQYTVGHQEKVKDIRHYLQANYPNLHILGASYDGVGIPDCIQSAKDCVTSIL